MRRIDYLILAIILFACQFFISLNNISDLSCFAVGSYAFFKSMLNKGGSG